MFLFNYERISAAFIEQLGEGVLSGESAVLLGPRYNGKRHVLYCLNRLLEGHEVAPVVEARFLDEAPIYTAGRIYEILREAVARVAPDLPLSRQGTGNEMLSPLQILAERVGKPVTLLASNVDGVAHHLARTLLEGVRPLVEEGKLVVVMSGEDDFQELVYGPKSEFTCANQYVLQGYSEKDFGAGLDQYMANLRISFDGPEELRRRLWEQTGGNLYLLRIILWAALQSRSNNRIPADRPLTFDEVGSSLASLGVPGIYGEHIFRYATQLINREPSCWEDLDRLLQSKRVEIGAQENAPSHLELAGVAVRENSADGWALKFSSPIMEDFARHFYEDRHFGDLYARIGDWEAAFEHYKRLAPESRLRPLGNDDRSEVEATVSALCSSLYSEATHTSAGRTARISRRIRNLFADGCHYVLGYSEVTFWQRATYQHGADWQHRPLKGFAPPSDVLDKIAKLLPGESALPPGYLPLREPWNRYAAIAILPPLLSDEQMAVVVSDIQGSTSISRERELLTKQLLTHFVKAHTHAVTVDGIQLRGRTREQQIGIINTIFNSLGRHDVNVQDILTMAASGLRQLQYRRALFCLVNPDKQLIEGVLDHCEAPLVSIADRISYPLAVPTDDIQSYVIATGKAMIIPDATEEPLADQEVVRAGRMKSLAIIPMLNPAGDAIGTILVEKENRGVPSDEDVNDLISFGGQLAIAIEQCQRINLLERGLNMIPDPIFIVDGAKRPQYANRAASELLDIPIGWRPPTPTQNVSPLTPEAGPIVDLIEESLSARNRLASHVKGIGLNKEYRGAVVSNVIEDLRGRSTKVIGGLLRVQDLTYLYKVFEASRRTAEAHDTSAAMRYMLEAAKLLGHRWGRLYLVETNEAGEQLFVSKDCFGYPEEDREKEKEFQRGKVILVAHSAKGHPDWLCIEQNEPVVFCWREDLDGGQRFITEQGLKVINWKAPEQPAAVSKRPGDFWIDFPLSTSKKVLGKICLQCDEDLRPENFVYLKVLSESFAQLLEAYRGFEEERRMISVAVAERIMATLAHNIGTRLGSLPILVSEYRELEGQLGELKKLNDILDYIRIQTSVTIHRANVLLLPVNPSLTTVDIAEQVTRALKSTSRLPPGSWTVHCEDRPLEVQLDSNFFETALLEIVQNTLDAADGSASPRIEVLIERAPNRLSDAVTITYHDNGPGVPEELTERIFEDFFSQRLNKKIGTGLGLGFVRRVVQAHGGTIYCNGTNGRGAEFIITIPKKCRTEGGR
jgi:two-component sensor histidine kinase/PAS domain-containing protein